MYEGVSISKKDKDWSRKLFKEAEKSLSEFEDREDAAQEMIYLAAAVDKNEGTYWKGERYDTCDQCTSQARATADDAQKAAQGKTSYARVELESKK